MTRTMRFKLGALGTMFLALLCQQSSRADEAELRALIEKQNKKIEDLNRLVTHPPAMESIAFDKSAPPAEQLPEPKAEGDAKEAKTEAPKPAAPTFGYDESKGFFWKIEKEDKEDCESKFIPFELRIRGRAQLDYYFYKVTDNFNHLTNAFYNPPAGDFDQLEVKRLRLVFAGSIFSPNLRYWFELDGNTRGLGGTQNNRVIQSGDTFTPAASAGAPGIGTTVNTIGGGVTVDHAVRLFSAYVAYDWHGFNAPDPGSKEYAPTYTLIAGKLKPLFGLEEYLGSGNQQMVEFSMANWFFDADDDNLLMAAGLQIKAFQDRLFVSALVTNGSESQFPNTQMDGYPGFNFGLWWDFGGTWDEEKQRWKLFGPTLSDLDYSENPVMRVGGAANIVPMDRRSLYGDLEQSRFFTMPAGPGGTRLINLLSGFGDATNTPNPFKGAYAVDEFEAYSFNAFWAGKYRGFSLYNEWWVRDLCGWATAPAGFNHIVYTDGTPGGKTLALFPNKGLVDFGTTVQGGYFVVPKKWEVVGRMSMVSGQSGDIGTKGRPEVGTVTFPGVIGSGTPAPPLTPVHVYTDTFTHYSQAYEYGVGLNRFWFGQRLKWQTDFSVYTGAGNPAGGGQSPAGFIAGVNGWMLRTQIQLAF